MLPAIYERWTKPGPFEIREGYYVKEAHFISGTDHIDVLLAPYNVPRIREPKPKLAADRPRENSDLPF